MSPFAGSVPAKLVPGVLPLSLHDAINRGLKQNLGLLLSHADIRSARGERWEQLSALLPHVTAAPYVAESKLNIDELGFAGLGARHTLRGWYSQQSSHLRPPFRAGAWQDIGYGERESSAGAGVGR